MATRIQRASERETPRSPVEAASSLRQLSATETKGRRKNKEGEEKFGEVVFPVKA